MSELWYGLPLMPSDSPPRSEAARPSQSLCGSPPQPIGYRWLPAQPARLHTSGGPSSFGWNLRVAS